MVKGVLGWLDDRLDLTEIRHFVAEKSVPIHAQEIWYYLGGMTMFLFGVQVFTGILLLLYYRPSSAEAYESVQFIVTQVEFGWLIRNVHSWSANLLIALAFAHFFSVFFLKSYRKPRELTWLTGIVLLFLMLGFGFSGYLLPWNELSFFATKVGTGIAGAVPLIGPFTLRVLRGGDDVTGATLSRFYGLHVAILPAMTTALVAVHLLLVQRQGMSVPIGIEKREKAGLKLPQMKFFPNYILRDVLAWYVVLAVVAALAAFYPWELGKKADPFAVVPPGIRPEWYFLAMFHTLKLVPSHVLGLKANTWAWWRSGSRRCSWCWCRSWIAGPAAGSEVRSSRFWLPWASCTWSCSPSSVTTLRRRCYVADAQTLPPDPRADRDLCAGGHERSARAGGQYVPRVPCDAHRREAGGPGQTVLGAGRPS
jgi:cytochrome b6